MFSENVVITKPVLSYFRRQQKGLQETYNRSGLPKVFFKKGFLKNFAKFTGKHLCRSLHKVADLRLATLLKKETPTQVLSCEFCKIFKNSLAYRAHLAVTSVSSAP